MEIVPCIICGHSEVKHFKPGSKHLNLLPPFEVKRCSNCSLLYLSPRPSESQRIAFFKGNIPEELEPYAKTIANYTAVTEGRWITFYDRIVKLTSHLNIERKEAKILDIGASSGTFVEAASSLGFDAYGIEPSEQGFKTCQQKGLNVVLSTAESLPYEDNFFDFVHSNHVFEHLSDPMSSIKEAYRVLKPGGKILIEVPNQFDNIQFYRDRLINRVVVRERNIRSIHHLYFFSRKTLALLLESAGFKNVAVINKYGKPRKGIGKFGSYMIRFIGNFFLGGPIIEVKGIK